jgi:hypothetical protein
VCSSDLLGFYLKQPHPLSPLLPTQINTLFYLSCLSGPPLQSLLLGAQHTLKQGAQPGTDRNQSNQIAKYQAFCSAHKCTAIRPSLDTLLAFIQFLFLQLASPRSVRNYFSGVRLLHKQLNISWSLLYSYQVERMLKGVDRTLPHVSRSKLPITFQILSQLISLCSSRGREGKALKVAFLFAFFGFLRQSNLAPPTSGSFDRRRHTRRADISVHASGTLLTLRWTKTLQDFSKSFHIPLPSIPGSPICPKAAYLDFIRAAPGHSQDPLLSLPSKGRTRTVLSAGFLRKCLLQFITSLQLSPGSYSLHSLRRGGDHCCLPGRCHYFQCPNARHVGVRGGQRLPPFPLHPKRRGSLVPVHGGQGPPYLSSSLPVKCQGSHPF